MTPRPSDMVLCQGIDPVSGRGRLFPRVIAHCQRNCSEQYTDWEASWTHAGILEHWGRDAEAGRAHRVIEARGLAGVTKRWYDTTRERWVVLRYACVITTHDRAEIVRRMDDMVGHPYDWSAVTFMLIRHWFHRWAHVPFDTEAKEFCSEALARAYDETGITLPTTLAPSEMWPAELARMWDRGALECVFDSVQTNAEISGNLICSTVLL